MSISTDITYTNFRAMLTEAARYEDGDAFVDSNVGVALSHRALSRTSDYLTLVWTYHDTGLYGLRCLLGYSRIGLSESYSIPLRTLEDWDAHPGTVRNRYVRDLVAFVLISEAMRDR